MTIEAPATASTWIEVRRDALLANLRYVRALARVETCAVVKANGYGHGLVEAARTFADGGASMLGVTRLDEAMSLRDAGVDTPILVMAPGADPATATRLRCSFALDDPTLADAIPDHARVHLKVDTGMGRFGVRAEDALPIVRKLAERGVLEGVMTHFAEATSPGARRAMASFSLLVHAIRGEGIDVAAHAAGSAALLAMPESRLDLVRVGTLLYGQDPPGVTPPWDHAETFAWHARVASVRALRSCDTVGYGSEFTAKRALAAVTVPIGWGDGFGVDVVARTPSVTERGKRIVRATRGTGRSILAVASADGTPLPQPIKLQAIGRIGMQATTFTDPTGALAAGAICRIPARRITVSAAIPRVVV